MTAGRGDLVVAVVTAGERSQGHIWMGLQWEHLVLQWGEPQIIGTAGPGGTQESSFLTKVFLFLDEVD